MKTQAFLSKTTLAALFAVFLCTATMQNAVADRGKRTFVGSWIVDVSPNLPGPLPFKNLATIGREGTIVNSDPDFGGGHGVWARTGRRHFATKFLTLIPPDDPSFPPNTTITVVGNVTLDHGGNTAGGPFVTEFSDADGNVFFAFDGEVEFTRISLGD